MRSRYAAALSPAAFAVAVAVALVLAGPVTAQESQVEARDYAFDVAVVATDLEHPWALAFLPDGRFLVTERDPGTIRIGSADGGISGPIHEIPDLYRPVGPTPRSQAGLFDIKLHPDFATNGLVYWVYSRTTERGSAVVVQRARLATQAGGEHFADVEDVWVMDPESQDGSPVHFGGRLAWAPDGMLLLTIGDRFMMNRAQELDQQVGAVLRMTESGGVPGNNPRFDDEDADPYLFTVGHRNVQAIAAHPLTGEIWAVEHGPLGGDEINRLMGGSNHGWPFITGGDDYSGAPIGVGTEMEGKVSPVHIFEETVAPSGMVFVHGEPALAAWDGDMLVGGLIAEGIVRVRLQDGTVVDEEWLEIGRRVRDVEVRDGSIWVVTEHSDGEILRLTPRAN